MISTKLGLWNQANVHISADVSRLHSDPSSVSSHKSNETYPIISSNTLHVGGSNSSDTLCNGSLESEGLVDDGNVVIDRFWNANADSFILPVGELVVKLLHTLVGAVASNNIQLIQTLTFDRVSYFLELEASP